MKANHANEKFRNKIHGGIALAMTLVILRFVVDGVQYEDYGRWTLKMMLVVSRWWWCRPLLVRRSSFVVVVVVVDCTSSTQMTPSRDASLFVRATSPQNSEPQPPS